MTCGGRVSSIPLLGLMKRTWERVYEPACEITERRLFRVLAVNQTCNAHVSCQYDCGYASLCSHVHHDEKESMRHYDHERIEYLFCKRRWTVRFLSASRHRMGG